MQPCNQTIRFHRRELYQVLGTKGSRLRCLMYTTGSPDEVADRLTRLIDLDGVTVAANNLVMPRGFLHKDEAKLGVTPGFLTDDQREEVLKWWLKVRPGANIPNWDIAANATIQGRPGLVLVEAKAHTNELETAGKPIKPKTNMENHNWIGEAIQAANRGLEPLVAGWKLSRDTHYQLSNRFAWSWKIASMGVPVVLVYLGFLNADEMDKPPFRTAGAWVDCVREWSRGSVPEQAWDKPMSINGTPLIPLIRAAEVRFEP